MKLASQISQQISQRPTQSESVLGLLQPFEFGEEIVIQILDSGKSPDSLSIFRISERSTRHTLFVVLRSPRQLCRSALMPSCFSMLLSRRNSYCARVNFVKPHVSPNNACCLPGNRKHVSRMASIASSLFESLTRTLISTSPIFTRAAVPIGLPHA